MIWTITLWMAMQGQVDNSCAETPPSLCFYKGCEKMAVEIDGGCPVLPTTPGIDPNMTTPPKNYMMPPNLMESVTQPVSAEHVFEIRTTRDLDKPSEGNGLIGCREGFKFIPELRFQSAYSEAYCVRITRELWLDGKRLGIIKGLD